MCFVFRIYVEKTDFPSFSVLSRGFLFNSKSKQVLFLSSGSFFFLYAVEYKLKVAAEIFGTKTENAEPIF